MICYKNNKLIKNNITIQKITTLPQFKTVRVTLKKDLTRIFVVRFIQSQN